uniref:Uncharacterized protein n=1 Tax=Rhizophora mucronata TaxID=61149 RepID=A0A2P2NWP2_RHIMU
MVVKIYLWSSSSAVLNLIMNLSEFQLQCLA